MFAQWTPGKVTSRWIDIYSKDHNDTEANRLKWFRECICAVDALQLEDAVAMPYKIGCGLAGGNWQEYQKILDNASTNIVLYKYE